MISIKDAGRYANYLENIISNVESTIWNPVNYMRTSENHLRSKANADAADEVVNVPVNRVFKTQVHNLAHLINKLIDEKLMLAMAIEKAKSTTTIQWEENGQKLPIDTAVEYSKKLRSFAGQYLLRLNNAKTTETKKTTYGQKFNVEGNQVNYAYIVETKEEVDFDKTIVRDLYKKSLEKADKISSLIDTAMSAQIIDFEPKYDIHDNFEEIIAQYEANL